MKLQARILILFAVVFGVVAGGLVLERNFDLARTSYVLNHELAQHKQYSEKLITLQGQALQTISIDYSFWDDMVTFVKKRNLTFANDNIDTGIATFNADAAWVYRTDNSLVYFVAADGTDSVKDLKLSSDFFAKLNHDRLMHFYVKTVNGLMEIRAATVHPGDDSAHKTTPQGYWLVGRYWNDAYLSTLSNLTQDTVKLGVPTASTANKIGSQSISYTSSLTNWDGSVVATLNSSTSVPVIKDLQALYLRQFILLMIVMFVTITVVLLALWRLVLAPLSLISRSIQSQSPENLDELAKQNTELGSLAQTVQLFYRQEIKMKESDFIKLKLEELNQAKSEFLAIAAHELKGPVGNVHIFSENLADIVEHDADQAAILVEVERISKQAHKATLLINDIYQASKGGQVLIFNRTLFSFDDFVKREVEDAQYSTDQKIILEGTSGKQVNSDVDRLGQVMTNLIRNASKYSPHTKEIKVLVSYENNNVVVEVQDLGLGISVEDMPKLFNRFFRSQNVATSYPGLGLGLSVCKEIVDGLDGKIWLTSELGEGSSFYFSLPVAPSESEIS